MVDVTPVDGQCPTCGGDVERVAERTDRTRRLRIPDSTTEVEVVGVTLSVGDQIPVDAGVILPAGDSWAPTVVWERLVDAGLDRVLLDAVLWFRQHSLAEVDQHLAEAGVDGLSIDGRSLWAQSVREAAKPGRGSAAAFALVDLAGQLGGRTSLGVASSVEDIHAGPVATLRAAEVEGTVAVRLDEGFRSARPEHRRRTLALLVDLGRAVDVELVTGVVGQRFLARKHAADLPECVVSECRARQGSDAVDDVDAAVEEVLAALDFDQDGIDRALVERVAEAPDETVGYDALTGSVPVARSTVRDHVATGEDSLTGRDVLARMDLGSTPAVTSGPLFEAVLERLDDRERLQEWADRASQGSEGGGGEDPESGRVGNPQNPASHGRDLPRTRGGGDPPGDTGAADSAGGGADAGGDPAAVAAEGAAPDRRERDYCHVPRFASRWRHAAVAGAAQASDVTLVERAIEGREDPCEATRSWDGTRGELVVSADYRNPLQHMVSVAVALTSDWVLEELVLDEELLASSELAELLSSNRELLREARCMGWMSEQTVSGVSDYVERLREAREELKDLSRAATGDDLEDEEERALRREATRTAHGLCGVMSDVLALLDVELLWEIRLPDHLSGATGKTWRRWWRRGRRCSRDTGTTRGSGTTSSGGRRSRCGRGSRGWTTAIRWGRRCRRWW